jgi:EAL domain-containing protein (putative c-di-GMP-specific phosphodiesterase class I)
MGTFWSVRERVPDKVLRGFLADTGIDAIFQPIVELVTAEVVGFEALTRGPPGTQLENPLALLAAAQRAGTVEELDWSLAGLVARKLLEGRVHPSLTIFINFKPTTLTTSCPDRVAADINRARSQLRIVAEMDEEDLRHDPASVLASVSRAREDGWGVALDNVGVTPTSLALLPVMRPDVVKVNLPGVSEVPDQQSAEIETSVRAYAEGTGATVLVKRIESTEDILRARAFGAKFGQGWRYGPGEALPQKSPVPLVPLPLLPVTTNESTTPFRLVAARREPEPIEKRLLVHLSSVVERRALDNGGPTVLLACVQSRQNLYGAAHGRYAHLAQRMSFTAIFGTDVSRHPLHGAHLVDVPEEDPLSEEWNVIVVGPNYSGALVARERGDGKEGTDRQRFDYVVTHDRDLVLSAARTLLRWIHR